MRRNAAHHLDKDRPAPNPLPSEDEALSYDACIVLAAQHAPDMINSVIAIEIADTASNTAFYQQFPSVFAVAPVTSNLTQQHPEYSSFAYRMGLSTMAYEPILSHFNHKAVRQLQEVALYTHMKALEKKGEAIGTLLLRYASRQKVREQQVKLLELAQELARFYRARLGDDTDQLTAASSRHEEQLRRLALEKTDDELASLRLSLKFTLGLDLDRKIEADGQSLLELLRAEGAGAIFADKDWETAWADSPEARMIQASKQAAEHNVMVAWTRYLPTGSANLFSANPKSDYGKFSMDDDFLLGITFTMPLVDWGARSRGVDSARLRRQQETQRAKLGRLQFSHDWRKAWQALRTAASNLDFAGATCALSELQARKLSLQHGGGAVVYSDFILAQQKHIENGIKLEEASLALRLQELNVWLLNGNFRRRYLVMSPDDEKKVPHETVSP